MRREMGHAKVADARFQGKSGLDGAGCHGVGGRDRVVIADGMKGWQTRLACRM